jgi:DNA polymerase-3 subunit delta'
MNTTFDASSLTIPCHLWIGSVTSVQTRIKAILQQQFCSQQGCAHCSTCQAIAQEQHYAIRWIRPEKLYTRDMLDPLFEQLAFALHENEKMFFVLEQVDFMPSACANSLLKSLEEPPRGYYFFLCAEREHSILLTIRSRCMIHHLQSSSKNNIAHTLFDYFSSTALYDPATFLKDLEQSDINEKESITLLDALLAHWMQAAKQAVQKKETHRYQTALAVTTIISRAFETPPMPGSSKIFWKNMYLAIKNLDLS